MTKTPATEADHSPVAIPAGSYDAETLQKKLDAATKAKAEDRDEKIAKILTDENQTPIAESSTTLLTDEGAEEAPAAPKDATPPGETAQGN